MPVKTTIEEDLKKDLVDALKIELEETPAEKLGDTMFRILIRGREFGLGDEEMEKLKEVFRNRLREIV